MKKLLISLIVCFSLCMLLSVSANCDEAKNIASECKITLSSGQKYLSRLLNDDYNQYWPCKVGDSIHIVLPKNRKAQGVMVTFLGDVPLLRIRSGDAAIGEYSAPYEIDYIPFQYSVSDFSIDLVGGYNDIRFCRLQILCEGDIPDWVQCWEELDGEADLMLVSTHPDDELLWFGGMLPTYAGEQRKKVIVVYMVANDTRRRCELLTGLWTCGVHYYPELGYFPDRSASSVNSTLKLWGEDEVRKYIGSMIRKYRPSVIAAQDINGEYGHPHHIVTTQGVIDCVEQFCNDPEWDPESAALYGPWQPKKLYIHLYKQDQIILDWTVPLDAFGGKTSFEIAKLAFKKHVSQQTGKYRVVISGKLDSRKFGLYWTSVGRDIVGTDLFENIE